MSWSTKQSTSYQNNRYECNAIRVLDRNSNAERNSSEWKHYVKVGLQGHRARDEADLQERIRAFELAPRHATGYFRHIGNNCASYTEGVRVFDN